VKSPGIAGLSAEDGIERGTATTLISPATALPNSSKLSIRSHRRKSASRVDLRRTSFLIFTKVRFAADSPLEGGVSCELVSENAKFPASWEYTGNFIDSGLGGASKGSEKGHEISFLRANSLRILTGNFLQPCRELNRAIREVSAVIRESRLPPQFGVRPW
jgi:hypothetical protein